MNASKTYLYCQLEKLHLMSLKKKEIITTDQLKQLNDINNFMRECQKNNPMTEYKPSYRQLYYLYGLWKKHNKSEQFIMDIYYYVLWYKKPLYTSPLSLNDYTSIIDFVLSRGDKK